MQCTPDSGHPILEPGSHTLTLWGVSWARQHLFFLSLSLSHTHTHTPWGDDRWARQHLSFEVSPEGRHSLRPPTEILLVLQVRGAELVVQRHVVQTPKPEILDPKDHTERAVQRHVVQTWCRRGAEGGADVVQTWCRGT